MAQQLTKFPAEANRCWWLFDFGSCKSTVSQGASNPQTRPTSCTWVVPPEDLSSNRLAIDGLGPGASHQVDAVQSVRLSVMPSATDLERNQLRSGSWTDKEVPGTMYQVRRCTKYGQKSAWYLSKTHLLARKLQGMLFIHLRTSGRGFDGLCCTKPHKV